MGTLKENDRNAVRTFSECRYGDADPVRRGQRTHCRMNEVQEHTRISASRRALPLGAAERLGRDMGQWQCYE